MSIQLSIVITTFNRASTMANLLASLEDQSNKNFQVIVAVDGSTDHTISTLSGLRVQYPLKWLDTNCQKYGLAVARNQGILASDGEAVVILDDDSYPQPEFVEAHLASVSPGTITGGPRAPSNSDAHPRMAWKMAELAKVPPLHPKTIARMRIDHPNAYLIENNICLLRDDWITLGLFSERLKMYGFIGQEFFARAEWLGFKYQYNPAAKIIHHGEFEGDNDFSRNRKVRETARASLIRPSLETPRQFRNQIKWAKALASGGPIPKLPPYWAHTALMLPYRLMRRSASIATSRVKAVVKGIIK